MDTPDPNIHWATVTITPHPQWVRLSSKKYRPDFVVLANEAIAQSGRGSDLVSVPEVLTGIYRLFHHHVLNMLEKNPTTFPNALQDCQSIIRRPDYTDDMLWNYLTHWGPEGDAVYRLTAEFLEESLPALVQAIQSGIWDREK